jgi:hypothetical protein
MSNGETADLRHGTGRWRDHALILLVLAVAAGLYFPWSNNDSLGTPFADGPNYLMMAEHYALHGHAEALYDEIATQARFPPLYPMLLSAFDAARNLPRAHMLGTSCFLLALLAIYTWLRRESVPNAQAALLVLAFAALPGSWLAGLSIQSEYLYLLFSMLALALMAGFERDRAPETLYAAALAVGAATLTRTVGISLLPALALLLLKAPRRSALLAAALALGPLLAWHLAHHSSKLGYGEVLQVVFGGNGWEGVRKQLAAEIPALYQGFEDNFLHTTTRQPRALIDALGLLGLVGAIWRATRLRPDGIYVVTHLAILLIWPFPEEAARFVWVLLPLLLAQPLLGVVGLSRSSRQRPSLSAVSPACLAIAIFASLPTISMAADRYRSAAYSELPETRGYLAWYRPDFEDARVMAEVQIIIIHSMQAVAEAVPAADCVMSVRSDLISYYGRRHAVDPPLNSVPDARFAAYLGASGCRYIFVSSTKDKVYPVLFHPLDRLGPSPQVVFQGTLPGSGNTVAALLRNPALVEPGTPN